MIQFIITSILLNSRLTKEFLLSIVNLNSKRPYTKKLSRIDFLVIAKTLSHSHIREKEIKAFGESIINENDYDEYINLLT